MNHRTTGLLAAAVFLTASCLPTVSWGQATAPDYYQVTTSPAMDRHATWAASGDFIVFESNRSGRFHLYKVDLDGGTPEQLTFGDIDNMGPEISPDGTRIVFARGQHRGDTSFRSSGIHWIPVDGGIPTELVPDDGVVRWHPTWSPDGSTIYYAAWIEKAGGLDEDIMRVPASGGDPELVISIATDAYPKISPAGTHALLSFRWRTNDPLNVVEVDLASPTSAVALTSESVNTGQAAYSPDGGSMIYASRKIGGNSELFHMDLESGESTRLTYDHDTHSYDRQTGYPEYSRDGSMVAFSSSRITRDENIWILNLDGEFPEENVLTVGKGRGLPGGKPVPITLSLRNSQVSRAMEFRVTDVPDELTISEVVLRGRASGMTTSFAENGDIHVLLYSPAGRAIPPGAGPILDLMATVRTQAGLGETIELELDDIVMSDSDGEAVEVEAVSGTFLVSRIPGDINGDNVVDVGDLVRLVEIILGTGRTPSGDELDAADCNEDEAINALDIVCLTDSILEGPAGPSIGDPMSVEVDLVVRTDTPVRGIQFRMPAGQPLPVSTDEIAPFSMYANPEGTRAIAFDPQGGEWEPGTRTPVRVLEMPTEIRAYGPGGKPLRVDISGNEVRIGEPVSAGLTIMAPMPNPFRSQTQILFTSDVPTVVRLNVFDIRGRRVSSSPEIAVTEGRHVIPWEARDGSGRALAAGMYIAVIDGGVRRASVRLTHLGN